MTDSVPESLLERLGAGDLALTVLPDGSAVILDVAGHQVLSLSKTGVVLVEQMRSGAGRIDDLAAALVQRFDVEMDEARRDTLEFVETLARAVSKAAD
jgi:hypothetical protein